MERRRTDGRTTYDSNTVLCTTCIAVKTRRMILRRLRAQQLLEYLTSLWPWPWPFDIQNLKSYVYPQVHHQPKFGEILSTGFYGDVVLTGCTLWQTHGRTHWRMSLLRYYLIFSGIICFLWFSCSGEILASAMVTGDQVAPPRLE